MDISLPIEKYFYLFVIIFVLVTFIVFTCLSKSGKIRNKVSVFIVAFISSIIISPLIFVIMLNTGFF